MSSRIPFIVAFLMGGIWAFSPGLVFYSVLIFFISMLLLVKNKDAFLFNLFFWGLGLRIFFSLLLFNYSAYFNARLYPDEYFSPHTPFFEDASYYLIRGFWLMKIHRSEITNLGTIHDQTGGYGESLFLHYIAILYDYFGYCPEIINLLSCLLGALLAIFCYFIALELFNNTLLAKITAFCGMFSPILFFISLVGSKDIIIIFLNCIVIISIVTWIKAHKIIYVMSAILSLWILSLVRPAFSFSGLLFLLTLVLFITYPMKWFRKLFMIILIFGIYLYPNPKRINTVHEKILSTVNGFYTTHLGYNTVKGSNYKFLDDPKIYERRYDINIAHELGWKRQSLTLVRACLHFLFEPFFWQKYQKNILILSPEMVLWYLMCPLAIIGMAISIRNSSVRALLWYLFFLMIPMALSSGNIGTVIRHRQLITPFYFMFSAVGGVFIFNKFNISLFSLRQKASRSPTTENAVFPITEALP